MSEVAKKNDTFPSQADTHRVVDIAPGFAAIGLAAAAFCPAIRKHESEAAWRVRMKYVRALQVAVDDLDAQPEDVQAAADALTGIVKAALVRTERGRQPGETVSAWKRRRRAGAGSAESPRALTALPLYGDLPSGIKQLGAKGVLTRGELRALSRFRTDYDLAYYSHARLTVSYKERVQTSGGSVENARASVAAARQRMEALKQRMTPGCWDVLRNMVVMDLAQGEAVKHLSRYSDTKARRYVAGALLTEAAGVVELFYA